MAPMALSNGSEAPELLATTPPKRSPNLNTRWKAMAGIALLAAAMLGYQVLLTRVAALRLHFHFGFLVISNCLLAMGAAGAVLTVLERHYRDTPERWIWGFTGLTVLSLPITWLGLLTLPVPGSLDFENASGVAQFVTFNLVAATPFFFGGAAIGLLLTANARRVHRIYAADLLGAAIGCLLCPALLWPLGAGGCFVVVTLLSVGAWVLLAPKAQARFALTVGTALILAGGFLVPKLDQWAKVPGKDLLDLTASVAARWAGEPVYSRWSANSRIDVLEPPEGLKYIFSRGDKALHMPIPEQRYILQDGNAGTFVTDFSGDPKRLDVLKRSLYSASVRLKDRPKVFVIGVGGGHDVWAAKAHGAQKVRGIELNRGVLDVHREVVPEFSKDLLQDPNIDLVVDEGRSALMRETAHYDVVQMTGIDTWTSLTSGAYVLAENYLYTAQAIEQMLSRLNDGGILHITRMAADMETLRLIANVDAAFSRLGWTGLEQSVAAISAADWLTTLMIKKGPWTEEEQKSIVGFASDAGFRVTYLPSSERTGLVEEFIRTPDKATFISRFPRNIEPTTDDSPYFFNFTRWTEPVDSVALAVEPTSVSQGNPAFILGQLGFSVFLALLFIVGPLVGFRHTRRALSGAPRLVARYLLYFFGVGVGYITVEIALMQKMTLLLGQPLYSITVTLFSLLLFTGLGSTASERWTPLLRRRPYLVPALLGVMVCGLVLLGESWVSRWIGSSLPWRAMAAIAAVAPFGFLLGIPFAHGIAALREVKPELIPWAWAVNGSASVIGSIGTVVVSMNAGFSVVLLLATLAYVASFAALGLGKSAKTTHTNSPPRITGSLATEDPGG